VILLKNDKVIDFLTWPPTDCLALKMFKLQHQFNNVVEITQLANSQMLEIHCHCECLKCPSPAPSSNTSLQSLNLMRLPQPCRLVLVASCPRYAETLLWVWQLFSVLFQACSKPATLHSTRDSPLVYIWRIWRPLILCDEIWTASTVRWKMDPVGSRRSF